MNNPSTQVVIVEMPVPPSFLYYFDNGEQDYDKFVETIEGSVADTNVLFFRTSNLILFPDSGWFNYNHLNAEGAPIFSEWLGRQVGQGVLMGTVHFAKANGE